MAGPIPKRTEERTRRNTTTESGTSNQVTKGVATSVSWPKADPAWDDFTKDWYNGLKKSGMSDYYQQSDVAMARIIANEMSIYQRDSRRSSMMFAALMTAMTGLGVTEGERRRMRIELEAPKEQKDTAGVTALKDYRKRLTK